MDIKDYLKKELKIPDTWDKHDFEMPRYSFGDIEDILQKVVDKNCKKKKSSNNEVSVCGLGANPYCRFRNKKLECTSLGDCDHKQTDC